MKYFTTYCQALALLVTPFGLTANAGDKTENSYEGKPLRTWLQALTNQSAPEERKRAEQILEQLASDPKDTLAVLVPCLQDPDEGIRFAAARVLGWCGSKARSATPSLIHTLEHDKSAQVRAESVIALRKVGEPKEIVAILQKALLHDATGRVRELAAYSLRGIASRDASVNTSALAALKDPVPKVRVQAVHLLLELEEPDTVIQKLLASAKEEADDAVLETIGVGLSPHSPSAAPLFCRTITDERLSEIKRSRVAVAFGFLVLRSERTIPSARAGATHIGKLLSNKDRVIRRKAVIALGLLGREAIPAVPQLRITLGDSDSDVRRLSIRALGEVGAGALPAAPALAAYLTDKSAPVRAEAAKALGKIRPMDEAIIMALCKAVADKSSLVRLNSIDSLSAIRKKSNEVVSSLETALHDEYPEIRRRAKEALDIINQP